MLVAGKFGKFSELSVIYQTKTIKIFLIINILLAFRQTFLPAIFDLKICHQTLIMPNIPAIWYINSVCINNLKLLHSKPMVLVHLVHLYLSNVNVNYMYIQYNVRR